MADAADDAERDFPFSDILEFEYFKKYKRAYYKWPKEGIPLGAVSLRTNNGGQALNHGKLLYNSDRENHEAS